MDHAAAHERIEDLLLEPARLAALEASTAPGGRRAARAPRRLPGLPRGPRRLAAVCRWPSRTRCRAIAGARPRRRLSSRWSCRPRSVPASWPRGRRRSRGERPPCADRDAPVAARSPRRRLGAVGRPGGVAHRARRRRRSSRVDQVGQRAAAEAEARSPREALAAVDRVLATDHKVVELRTSAGGRAAGSISWSRHDWVVLTERARPSRRPTTRYLCWLETDGRSVPSGTWSSRAATAYWVASLDEWQTWEIGPTTRFVVSLEAGSAGAAAHRARRSWRRGSRATPGGRASAAPGVRAAAATGLGGDARARAAAAASGGGGTYGSSTCDYEARPG